MYTDHMQAQANEVENRVNTEFEAVSKNLRFVVNLFTEEVLTATKEQIDEELDAIDKLDLS